MEMQKLIEGFAAQLQAARNIGRAQQLKPASQPIQAVALMGLGGSAFGGEVVRNYTHTTLKVPFNIYRSYDVPASVGPHTLAIASSYSGNTEETLAALDMAIQQQAQLVGITSGGRVMQTLQKHGHAVVQVPAGSPPRSAVGYSVVQQLYILRHYGLIPDFEPHLDAAIRTIEQFADHDAARQLAQALHGRAAILYSSDAIDSIAIRLRQQINENAKQLCWHHVIPEMNHNELVGWQLPKQLIDNCVVVMLRSSYEHRRVTMRFDINDAVIRQYTRNIEYVQAKGDNLLAQLLYLLHFSDWVSIYLAQLNQVDPIAIHVIDYLKSELGSRP